MRSDFYVYALLDPRRPGRYSYGNNLTFEFEPFYIGKGKGSRDRSHFRLGNIRRDSSRIKSPYKTNKILRILDSGMSPIIKRIKANVDEKTAFRFELKAIELIGRKKQGGPLTNATNGGEGISGYVMSVEAKLAISEWNRKNHASMSSDEKARRSAKRVATFIETVRTMPIERKIAWYKKTSDTAKNRTPEERAELGIKFRNAQFGMDTKAWNLKNQRTSKGLKRYRKSMTLEAKVKESQILSEAQRRYWSSLRKEERLARADAIANGYARKDKASLAAKNAKISATISKQHSAQSLYDKRMRAFMVMCGVMIRNAQNEGREFDVEGLKAKLRAQAAKYYAIASNLDTIPTKLREQVRQRIPA